MKEMGFATAFEIAQDGFNVWAEKPHNKKWLRRIDGTPIPNDLIVCIAEQFAAVAVDPAGLEAENN